MITLFDGNSILVRLCSGGDAIQSDRVMILRGISMLSHSILSGLEFEFVPLRVNMACVIYMPNKAPVIVQTKTSITTVIIHFLSNFRKWDAMTESETRHNYVFGQLINLFHLNNNLNSIIFFNLLVTTISFILGLSLVVFVSIISFCLTLEV